MSRCAVTLSYLSTLLKLLMMLCRPLAPPTLFFWSLSDPVLQISPAPLVLCPPHVQWKYKTTHMSNQSRHKSVRRTRKAHAHFIVAQEPSFVPRTEGFIKGWIQQVSISALRGFLVEPADSSSMQEPLLWNGNGIHNSRFWPPMRSLISDGKAKLVEQIAANY